MSSFLFICHRWLFQSSLEKESISQDIERKLPAERKSFPHIENIEWILTYFPEYRNIFYYRIEKNSQLKDSFILKLAKWLYPPIDTLFIWTPEIGPGLYIQHGFATAISAKKIGKNCWINQQVTIGWSDNFHRPTIGNNVTIYAGAKIIGAVKVGNNSIIGANAVVVKDVPANCTVVGVPAYIIKKNGKKLARPQKLK